MNKEQGLSNVSEKFHVMNIEPKLDVEILKFQELRSNTQTFPEIKMEMNAFINECLIGDKEDKIVGDLRRSDFWRLSGQQKCNDLLLDEFFQLVQKRSLSTDGLAKLYCMNTFAFEKMGTEEGNSEIATSLKVVN